MRKSAIFSIVIMLTLSLSLQAQSFEEQVKAMQSITEKAMEDGDPMATLGQYTNDAIEMPSYAPMMEGIDAIKVGAEMQKMNPMKMKDFTLTTKVLKEEGKYGYEVGTYSLAMEMPGMDKPWKDMGKYMTVYEKQDDGKWKVKYSTWNSDHNPYEDMQKLQQKLAKMEKKLAELKAKMQKKKKMKSGDM